jgi:FkbM family methyltransferase
MGISIIKKIFSKSSRNEYHPSWHMIKNGSLQGREVFVDPKDGYWQKDIIDGNHDKFFFNYLHKFDLRSKTVFEIGAHIGYHAMMFAQLVGEAGYVHAFEPNVYNRERLQLILSKNRDLSQRIKIYEFAVSDKIGEIQLSFSPNIDDGKSSGSFIAGSHTPFKKDVYDKIGFNKVNVKTITLDQLSSIIGNDIDPFLIKIDVEGAEHLVLQGGINIIKKYKPILLIEIHSIFNMLKVCEYCKSVDYIIELLNEEDDGRCFIAATSRQGNTIQP